MAEPSEPVELPENEKVERRRQASIFKDARIDRAITWTLTFIAGVVVCVVLAYAKGIDAKLDKYGDTLAAMQQDIAVLKDERREIAELKTLVGRLEERLHTVELKK